MNERIEELLTCVLDDCQNQVNCLKETDDVSWDCYVSGNWQVMADNISEAIMLINKDDK